MLDLKEVIAKSGMSRDEVAKQAGVTERALLNYIYKDRTPSPVVADRLGNVLNLTRDQLWEMFYN